jgi:hypothetical protein
VRYLVVRRRQEKLSQGVGMMLGMEAMPMSPWFGWWGQQLCTACRRLGLLAPSFQSPPAIEGADRTLRRTTDGRGVVISVRLWPRPLARIRGDMIDGILAANGLRGARADDVRRQLEEVVPVPDDGQAA